MGDIENKLLKAADLGLEYGDVGGMVIGIDTDGHYSAGGKLSPDEWGRWRNTPAERVDTPTSTPTVPRGAAAPLDGPAVDVGRRLVRGYASVFGVPDTSATRDIVLPGAFRATLAELERTGRALPLLVGHQKNLVVGETVRLVEDGYGLYLVARLFPDDEVPNNGARLAMMERDTAAGRPTGLSVGLRVLEAAPSPDRQHRIVQRAELHEISLALSGEPAQALARLGERRVKTIDDYRRELAELELWGLRRDFDEAQYAVGRRQHRIVQLAALDPVAGFDLERSEQRRHVLARLKAADPLTDWEAHLPAPAAVAHQSPAELARELKAADNRLFELIDKAESRRIYDPAFRRTWDHKHPGTINACACHGHRVYRREIEPGADD
jgi:HK97 family phage prohead protease